MNKHIRNQINKKKIHQGWNTMIKKEIAETILGWKFAASLYEIDAEVVYDVRSL